MLNDLKLSIPIISSIYLAVVENNITYIVYDENNEVDDEIFYPAPLYKNLLCVNPNSKPSVKKLNLIKIL